VSIQAIGSERPGNDHLQSSVPLLALVGVCLVLLALLLSQLAAPGLVFGVMGLLVACVVVPARWPYGAFLVLATASVMPSLKVEIGGWNARPEHYAALLVSVVLLSRLAFRQSSRITLAAPDYWVAAYAAWNYVSSAWMSPDPKMTLRWALLNNLVILPYFLIRFLVTDQRLLRWMFNAFLGVGISECAYAVICYVSRHILGTSFGVAVGQYAAGLEGVYGTHYEPNILGSYSACLAIMLLVLVFLTPRTANWVIWGTVIALASLLMSLSRAAFLSFVFAALVLPFMGIRSGAVNPRKLLTLGLGVALFTVPIAASGGKNLFARFANLSPDDVQGDVETMGRLISVAEGLKNIAQHPIVGNGTASFQLLADPREAPILGEQAWIANSVIRILHDTGVIGLLLFMGAILSIGPRIKKAIAGEAPERAMVLALSAGCLVYVVAFMSAEGTMLSFFWVHIGLLSAACSFATGNVSAAQGAR
jgi:O-Antigen ligase